MFKLYCSFLYFSDNEKQTENLANIQIRGTVRKYESYLYPNIELSQGLELA